MAVEKELDTVHDLARGMISGDRRPLVTNGTLPACPSALEFAHGYHRTEEISLPAMRNDRRPLRMRKVLLPLPIADGRPPMRRQLVLLPTLS